MSNQMHGVTKMMLKREGHGQITLKLTTNNH